MDTIAVNENVIASILWEADPPVVLEGDPRVPFYHLVPKDIDENLKFREEMLRWGSQSIENAQLLWIMCRRDLLFYVNTFVWTYDPRKAEGYQDPVAPFVTYQFQDKIFLDLIDKLGREDVLVEKSRDMGLSWICLTTFEWRWHFYDMQTFLMISRKESYVDELGNPDALFWKIDWIHQCQPGWLLPNMSRKKMHIENLDTGSTIDGETSSGDAGTGGRRTAILLDEFSKQPDSYAMLQATRDVTRCRVFNFTPSGTGNAAYDLREKGKIYSIKCYWPEHPEKNRGLYRVHRDGRIEVLDQEWYEAHPGYQFRKEPGGLNGLRSPWYDDECDRAVHRMEIASQLDGSYLSSQSQFFDPEEISEHKRRFCRIPLATGMLDYDTDTIEPIAFTPIPDGNLKLWCHLTSDGRPVKRNYVVGVDTSAGTGASNSAICVVDRLTGEQVAEYTSPDIRPEALANIAVALCRWFRGENPQGAYLIWEANGPGRNFGDRVLEIGYGNFYFRKQEEHISRKTTDIPGWFNTPGTGKSLFGSFRAALNEHTMICRSEEALRETLLYVYGQNDEIYHRKSRDSVDSSGARDNHGDRVIAVALCWWVIRGIKKRVEKPKKDLMLMGCYAWRRKAYEQKHKAAKRW